MANKSITKVMKNGIKVTVSSNADTKTVKIASKLIGA